MKCGFVDTIIARKDLPKKIGTLLSILLNKNSEVNSSQKMKLQKILSNFQKLHPKEIDLSLDRIKKPLRKIRNPQNDIKCIQVCGTNGKGSTISFLHSILKEAKIKCNVYTSPHVRSINERFIYNDEIISDDELAELLKEVEDINDGQPLTYFEALTAAFFTDVENIKIISFLQNLVFLEGEMQLIS